MKLSEKVINEIGKQTIYELTFVKKVSKEQITVETVVTCKKQPKGLKIKVKAYDRKTTE